MRTCWEECAKLGGGVGPGRWVWEEMVIGREPASSKGPRDEDRRPPGRASGQQYVQSPEAELAARPEGPRVPVPPCLSVPGPRPASQRSRVLGVAGHTPQLSGAKSQRTTRECLLVKGGRGGGGGRHCWAPGGQIRETSVTDTDTYEHTYAALYVCMCTCV